LVGEVVQVQREIDDSVTRKVSYELYRDLTPKKIVAGDV